MLVITIYPFNLSHTSTKACFRLFKTTYAVPLRLKSKPCNSKTLTCQNNSRQQLLQSPCVTQRQTPAVLLL